MRKPPPSSVSQTDASDTARNLRIVLGQMKRKLRGRAPPGDLTWSQVSVLQRLEYEGPATVSTLAAAEGVRPQSMGAIVAALEADGLVQGTVDPKDKRQTILSLTEAFKDWVKVSRAAREDWLFTAIQEKLSPQEQKELAHAVSLLKRLVDS